jgi:hypothetical protein
VTDRKTQRGKILGRLVDARGAWVPLPQILALGVAQYGARIHELRALGFRIENRKEHIDGVLHTWFRLDSGPAITPRPATAPSTAAPVTTDLLFGPIAPDRTYSE